MPQLGRHKSDLGLVLLESERQRGDCCVIVGDVISHALCRTASLLTLTDTGDTNNFSFLLVSDQSQI